MRTVKKKFIYVNILLGIRFKIKQKVDFHHYIYSPEVLTKSGRERGSELGEQVSN
jgi:hypothetical protein